MSSPRIGPFRQGMNNRRPDYDLALGREEGGGHLLRNAVNVDVTDQGKPRRRPGYARVQSGLNCGSLWSPVHGRYALYADAGDVFMLDPVGDALARKQVASGFGRVAPVSFAEVHEAVYFTDGARVGSFHPAPGPTPRWLPGFGVQLGDQRLDAMPAGQVVAFHRNRTLVAVDAVLFYSEPFTPHLHDPAKGWMQFPARIDLVVPVEGGVFVCADRTYFLPGGLPAQSTVEVLPYGAVPGSAAILPEDERVCWMSTKGLVVGDSDGSARNVQEKHIAQGAAVSGATAFRDRNGLQQVVSTLFDQDSTHAGVGSFAAAALVRKGNGHANPIS